MISSYFFLLSILCAIQFVAQKFCWLSFFSVCCIGCHSVLALAALIVTVAALIVILFTEVAGFSYSSSLFPFMQLACVPCMELMGSWEQDAGLAYLMEVLQLTGCVTELEIQNIQAGVGVLFLNNADIYAVNLPAITEQHSLLRTTSYMVVCFCFFPRA